MAKKVDLPEPIIPNASWKIVELGDYVKILNGYPFDSGRFTNSSENAFPLIRIRDVVRGYTETFTDEDCPDEYKIKKDEILIGMDGDFNISRWKSDFGLLNQRVCKIKSASKDLDDKFLYYYLPIPLKQINDATPSVTVKHLSSNSLLQLHFPLPPLTEQQRIVNRIETMFAKLDQAQEKAQAVQDSFETRKAAILHKAFTGELTANWRKENGVPDDSWEEKTLKDICSKITDGTHNSPLNTEIGEFKYITAKNIKESGIDLTNITFVTKEIHQEIYSRCNVEKGDVLYIKDGATTGIATVNTLDEEFSMLSSVADIKPTKELLDSKYLAYVLNSSEVKAKMLNEMSGNAITRLTLVKIKNAEVPVCSLPEQQEIVRILDTVLEKESRAKEAAQTVLDQIALLKKSILARAFRGEL